ncbi:hypothetical protein ANN_11621 [Periplaneta americana]|uniref:Uncharacterized protein n=1 Tax=Periplaneta americana TaxID=6978 RepID=A0ABQ8T5I7_PERAM|nr:hypothetical protein ANN_11621 [Periplaneta americana]
MDLRELGYDGRDWIILVQDRDRWRAYTSLDFSPQSPAALLSPLCSGTACRNLLSPLPAARRPTVLRGARVDSRATCSLAGRWSTLFNDPVSTTRSLIVDGIYDIDIVFGEMSPKIRHRLPDIRLTAGENLRKTQPERTSQNISIQTLMKPELVAVQYVKGPTFLTLYHIHSIPFTIALLSQRKYFSKQTNARNQLSDLGEQVEWTQLTAL